MAFKFDSKFKLDKNKFMKKHESALGFAQYVLDNQIIKDSNYFIPVDQHYLEKSALLHSKIGEGIIIWQTPYARRLYYNPQYNFSKDKNPNAQGKWFEAAKAKESNNWEEVAELAYKSKL